MPRVIRFAVVAAALASSLSVAADFPERPVRLIVQFPPGGGTDAFGRILGAKLSDMWGQQVIVDNRSGAQGNIGTSIAAKATPDGYTMIIAHQGVMTINVAMYGKPGFDSLRDFEAVARGTDTPNVITCHPGVAVKSVPDLVKLAKQSPGKLTYASTGAQQQLVGELFKITTATNMLHIPYKGAGPAVVDLVGGNVNLMFSNPTSVVPHVKGGRLRALGVLGPKRLDALPDAPNAAESGYAKLGEYTEWYGIAVPAGTPRSVVGVLEAAVLKAFGTPEVAQRLSDLGQQPSPLGAKEFAAQIRRDHERWGKLVRDSGIRVD